MAKLWLVDDDQSIRLVLSRALEKAGFSVSQFSDAQSALTQLTVEQPDVLLSDIRMPGMSGLQLLEKIHQDYKHIPCIIMTAHTDLDSALASYESGAFEYLPKPFDLDDAVNLAQRAVEPKTSAAQSEEKKQALKQNTSNLIGEAPAMQEVFRIIGRLAKSHTNVLIYGQSGTGKELVAKALHEHGLRAKQPFVAINIAAIPADLLESELFGHEKGAFTGAHSQRQGRFEQANQGTLFLDEIGEMSADLQTRLLRVLSDKRFYRVGGRDLVNADVRILAATNKDLEQQVLAGKFREDLYHRLNVIRIDLPSLKQRSVDIPLLAQHFLQNCAQELQVTTKQLDNSALEKMMAFTWPGNVRQLENVCRWLTVMAPSNRVSVDDLPNELNSHSSTLEDEWQIALEQIVRQKCILGQNNIAHELIKSFENVLLSTTLEHTQGHRQKAAKILGWGRNTLTRKLQDNE